MRIGHFGVLFGGNHFVGAPSSEGSSAPTFAWLQADRISSSLSIYLSDNVGSLCSERHLVAHLPTIEWPALVEAIKKTVNMPHKIPSGMHEQSTFLSMLAQTDYTNSVRECTRHPP